MNRKQITFLSLLLTALMIMVSCVSAPAAAPEDASAEQLIQLAQSSYDAGNTTAAIYYYETLISRYGDDDLECYIIAQYEIAHLLVKEGNTAEAERRLHSLLSLYSDEEQAWSLPQDYRKLAENELSRLAGK